MPQRRGTPPGTRVLTGGSARKHERAALLAQRCRRPCSSSRLALPDRSALRPPDGYRVGQATGWTASFTSCRRGRRRCRAAANQIIERFDLKSHRPGTRRGAQHRPARLAPGSARVIAEHRPRWRIAVKPGDVLITDMTDPGLGAGHEARCGHRHQPRRAHLPCRDHRARTRRAGRSSAVAMPRSTMCMTATPKSRCPVPVAIPGIVYEGMLAVQARREIALDRDARAARSRS